MNRVRERFDLIVNGPALFNAVVTGIELGIFRLLSEKPRSGLEGIAEATGLRHDKLRVLLHALCSTELIDRVDGAYVNSDYAEQELTADRDGDWLPILRGWREIYYPAFVHMSTALRDGDNLRALSEYEGSGPTLYQRLEHTPKLQETFHQAMSHFTLKSMSGLLESPELASVKHLLDVGGNDGTTATCLIDRFPNMDVTIFDLPTVADAAGKSTVSVHGDKVRLAPGDLFKDPFPRTVDAILFSHVLEIFSEEHVVLLLKKAYDALPSGGKVMTYNYNVSDDERSGLYSARLSLYLNVLASGQGMAYPRQDWERWVRQAGFVRVQTSTGLPYEHGLTVGFKP